MRFLYKLFFFILVVSIASAMVVYALNYQSLQTQTKTTQRYVADLATPFKGPHFSLDLGKSNLRVFSYLHLPLHLSESRYDPYERFDYDLLIKIYDKDEEITKRIISLQTQKTKVWNPITNTIQQQSFYPPLTLGEPADVRITDIDLSKFSGPGRKVEILAMGPFKEAGEIEGEKNSVSILAFQSLPRNPDRIEAKVSNFDRHNAKAILDPQEYLATLKTKWQRMTPNIENPTNVIFSSPNSFSKEQVIPETNIIHGVSVFNLKGPTSLSIHAVDEEAEIEIKKLISEKEKVWKEEESTTLAKTPLSAFSDPEEINEKSKFVYVKEGEFASIRIYSKNNKKLIFSINKKKENHEKSAIVSPGIVGEGQQFPFYERIRVLPDRKKITLDPLRGFLSYTIANDIFSIGDALLVKFRRNSSLPAKIQYKFKNNSHEIVAGEINVEATLSEFDRITMGRGVGKKGSFQISDASSFKFMIPMGATHFEITSKEDGIFSQLSALGLEDGKKSEYRFPYTETPPGLVWKYASTASSPWQRLGPDPTSHEMRVKEKVYLIGQVRWEIDPKDKDDKSMIILGAEKRKDFKSIYPKGGREIIWVPSGRNEKINRFEIYENQKTSCSTQGRFVVEYFATKKQLGAPISIRWNDQLVRRQQIRSIKGRFIIPANAPGILKIESHGLRLFSSCKPSKGKAWRPLKVSAPNTQFEISVDHHVETTTWINVKIYSNHEHIQIETDIDEGAPPRAEGHLTRISPAIKKFDLVLEPQTSFSTTRPFQPLRYSGRIAIPVGKNWKAGKRKIRLRSDTKIQVRFFSR